MQNDQCMTSKYRFDVIRIHLLSYHSRGTLMSYTNHSAQRRFKSNTPSVFSGWDLVIWVGGT